MSSVIQVMESGLAVTQSVDSGLAVIQVMESWLAVTQAVENGLTVNGYTGGGVG